MSQSCEYVVCGAMLKCNKGTSQTPIKATHDSSIHTQGKKVCTKEDKIPFQNISPFGMCSVTKMACIPSLREWNIPNSVSANNTKALLVKRAKAQCALGGTVTIQKSGQMGGQGIFADGT